MALEIHKRDGDEDMDMYEVDVRRCLTEDDRLVEENDPDARWLYCTPGQRIPMADAVKYGLVKPEKPEPKKRTPAANKQRTKGEDK